jgi:hypothetical protein
MAERKLYITDLATRFAFYYKLAVTLSSSIGVNPFYYKLAVKLIALFFKAKGLS